MPQPAIGPQRIRSSGTVGNDGLGLIVFDFTGYLSGRRGAITRMIAGLATPVGELIDIANDTFSRTVANTWGNADSGQAWTVTGAGWDVAGGVGTTPTTLLNINTLPLNIQDCTVLSHLPNLPGAATAKHGLVGRHVDASNYVYASIDGSTPKNQIIVKRVAGVETTIASTTRTGLPTDLNHRLTFDGTVVSYKVWDSSLSEPAAYDIQSGLAPTPVSSNFGIYFAPPSGGSQQYDTFLVSSATPQAPTWDAYIGDVHNPSNLVDSSQGVALPRWVPALVNGQPVSQGDVLTIVATGGSPGSDLVASCYLVTEPV